MGRGDWQPPTASSRRAWLRDPATAQLLRGARFALPWTHWFCSSVDAEFFGDNEFVACLQRMGLAKVRLYAVYPLYFATARAHATH